MKNNYPCICERMKETIQASIFRGGKYWIAGKPTEYCIHTWDCPNCGKVEWNENEESEDV